MDERKGWLRIAEDVKSFAEGVLNTIAGLPNGVTIDSISVKPDVIQFGQEIAIELPAVEEGDEE